MEGFFIGGNGKRSERSGKQASGNRSIRTEENSRAWQGRGVVERHAEKQTKRERDRQREKNERCEVDRGF